MPSGPRVQYVTKLQAARRQLVTAVRLFFDDREPVSVHTLAHASWEISSCLCRHSGVTNFLELGSKATGLQVSEIRKLAGNYKNFFKHADRDPEAALDDFGDACNDFVLFAATMDLEFLCKGRLPTELRTFYLWFCAVYPPPEKQFIKTDDFNNRHEMFWSAAQRWAPMLHNKSRREQKRLGQEAMLRFLEDPELLSLRTTDRTQIPFWT